jgi:hypothetical protein
MDTSEPRLRSWLNVSSPLIAAPAFALLTALALYLDLPELVPAVGFPWLAWVVWRRLHVSAIGMALGAVSLELVTWADSIASRSEGNIFMILPWAALLVGALVVALLAIVAFLVRAWRSKPNWRREVIAAAAAAPVFVLAFFAVCQFFWGANELRIARQLRANRPVWQALIDDVAAISQRLGRVPREQSELVKLRGKPMPIIPWPHWGRHDIRYRAISAERFALSFGGIDAEGLYVYDSGAPERGWYWSFDPVGRPLVKPSRP